ncbi:adenosine deaminase [Micromonospora sp. LOL_021]|uniref:adenosine deaminase n=1 Tax=Micromonospora sp. LOL_021 TaxID=3345417 RepID=UPI003A83EDDD
MPKVELHVHLEGTVGPSTTRRLGRYYGLPIGAMTESDIQEMFRFRDFAHFTEVFESCVDVLRRPEDLAVITTELGITAHQQAVRYLEVTFTPGMHKRARGLPIDEQLDAVNAGAADARRQTGIEMRFIIDHVRGDGPDGCLETAEWCVAGRDYGVVGLGLGGFEPGRPASLFDEAIRWAVDRGVPFVPHAGEAVGPESVWDCLRYDPPRIGHGVRSVADPVLLDELSRRGTVLELCPTSNLRTGVVRELAEYPLQMIRTAGIRFTLNSDDPALFQTDLTTEYTLAATHLGLTRNDLAEVTRTGLDAALLPGPERRALRAAVDAELVALGLPAPEVSTAPESPA